MLKLIIGRAGSGKTEYIRRALVDLMQRSDAEAVVIVPEQQTVIWETKMASLLPDEANLRLEITNFTRLSNSVFREYGGLADSPIDDGTRALLVWRAMYEIAPTLRVYGGDKLSRLDRNIPRMMKAVDELKNSGITPAEAEEALARLTESADGEDSADSGAGLAARLSDAVGVYAAYSAILSGCGIDRADMLTKLGDTLARHPYFRGKYVFVDSFFSLTSAEERILSEIMRQAEGVTVTFTCPHEDTGEIQFAETRAYLKTVKSYAARAGAETETVVLGENRRHECSPALAAVERYIFDYTSPLPDGVGGDSVRVIKCADRYDEAECAAAIIDKLVREGAAYSDIAVIAADMSSREGLVDAVLRRHGIRSFVSESTEVSTSPAVRLIASALRVEESGWARDEIIKMIKTGLTPLSDATAGALLPEDLFETYTATWNIRGRRMYTSDAWSMNPEGYKLGMTDSAREILAAVNGAKDALIPPLERFLSVFDGGVAQVREIAERIVYFAEELGVYPALLRMADAYRAIGMLSAAKKTEGMWSAICKILDKMTSALDGISLDAGTFCGLFTRIAASMDVGSIPTGVDEVIVGSAAGVRFDKIKYMIILGSVEGEFPATTDGSRDFFDDRDRVALEGVGLTLSSPDSVLCTAREYFMYYRTAASPSEKLFVLAPMGGDAGLSDGAQRILKLTGAEAESFAKMPLSEVVYTRAAAEYQLARRSDSAERALLDGLCAHSGASTPLVAEAEICGGATEKKVKMSLSESRLESFASCPFSYSCKYLAKLKPTAVAKIGTPDIGTFMHSVLEKFFTELSAEELSSMPLPRERTEELAERIIGEYIAALSASAGGTADELDGRLGYLFARLRRHVLVFLDAIMRELSQSEFVPVAYELPIGIGDGALSPIVFSYTDGEDSVEVVLRGIADRVDMYKNKNGECFVRIVDYKTGQKSFSIDDIYRGIGVQLLVYLFSVWKAGLGGANELNPAGAMYFSARPAPAQSGSMIGADEAFELSVDGVSRSGILLADEDVLTAMDRELGGKFVSVKRAADGGLKSSATSTTLVSAEEFGALYGDLSSVIGEIAVQMKRGVADARPKLVSGRSPCDYCDMKPICRHAEAAK